MDQTNIVAGALSKRRAEAVAEQMQRRGIQPILVTGFGAELPLADNSTPEGREKNRRLEVWISQVRGARRGSGTA
jgi:outer membrane protein OmpA-like peptidoglycan-associated protein